MASGATYELKVLLSYKDRGSGGLLKTLGIFRDLDKQSKTTARSVDAMLKGLERQNKPTSRTYNEATKAVERNKRSEVTATARAAREVERITAHGTRQAEQQYRLRERIATQSATRAATAQVREQRRASNEMIRLIDKTRRAEERPHARPGGRGGRGGIAGIAGVATGVAGAAYLGKGYRDSTSKEDALANLRATITKVGPDGGVNKDILASQMAAFEALGTELGNKLPGNFMQYIDQATTLKQRGLQVEDILGGAGRAAGYLSASSRADPQETAREVATFGQIYGLKGKEYEQSTDLLSRIKTAKDLDAGELIEASKYFQGRVGTPLGLSGLEGANQSVKYLAFMRQATGTEGSQLGTGTSTLIRRLIAPPKEAKDALAVVRKQTGIDLSPVDKKGKFIGLEALVEKFTKLEGKLSPAQLTGVANKIAGEEGSAAFTAMVEKGKGYRTFLEEINATIGMMDKADITTGTTSAKMEALRGTYENFNAEMFESLTKSLDPVIDKTNVYLGQLQGIAAQHQNVASFAAGVAGIGGAAVGATSGVVGLIDQLGLLGGGGSGGRGGGGYLGGGGIGGTGVGISDVLTGGWAGKQLLGRAAPLIGGGAGIAAGAGLGGYQLYKVLSGAYSSKRGRKKEYTQIDRELQGVAGSYGQRRTQGMLGADDAGTAAALALRSSSRGNPLKSSSDPASESWLLRGATQGERLGKDGGYLRDTVALLNTQTKGLLQFPEVMSKFRDEIGKLQLSPEAQGGVNKVLDAVATDFKAASDTSVNRLDDFSRATGRTSDVLGGFANRVNNIRVGGVSIFGGDSSGGSGGSTTSGGGSGPTMSTPRSRFGYDYNNGSQPTPSAPGPRMISSARGGMHIGSMPITVNVPAGSRAADDPQALAELVAAEMQRQAPLLGEIIDSHVGFGIETTLERNG
jgi:TP901 family phage tail tape measure protein